MNVNYFYKNHQHVQQTNQASRILIIKLATSKAKFLLLNLNNWFKCESNKVLKIYVNQKRNNESNKGIKHTNHTTVVFFWSDFYYSIHIWKQHNIKQFFFLNIKF